MTSRLLGALALAALAACRRTEPPPPAEPGLATTDASTSAPSGSPGPDTAGDTGGPGTLTDTATGDTGDDTAEPTTDTAGPEDTGDTAPATSDTGPDTAPSVDTEDSGAGPADTAPVDTAPAETEPASDTADTGLPADTAPPCVWPPVVVDTADTADPDPVLLGDLNVGDLAVVALDGWQDLQFAGMWVAGADHDGDGDADLIIHSRPEIDYWTELDVISVVDAPVSGTEVLELEDTVLEHERVSLTGMWNAGDLDGDGGEEILVGLPSDVDPISGVVGSIRALSGPFTGAATFDDVTLFTLWEPPGTPATGYGGVGAIGVGASGDVDGDGWIDVVASDTLMPRAVNNGAVYLIHGPVAGDIYLDTVSTVFWGEAPGDVVGVNPSLGDLDGDGLADLLVGTAALDIGGVDAGAIYAVLAPPSGEHSLADADLRVLGATDEMYLKLSQAVGDLTGDGYPDLMLGNSKYDVPVSNAGGGWIFPGPPCPGDHVVTDAPIAFTTTINYASVSADMDQGPKSGDFDGDGHLDLLVWFAFGAANDALFYGPIPHGTFDVELDSDAILRGETWGDGAHAISAGDTNGDGIDDVLIGGPNAEPNGTDSGGRVHLVLGGTL